LIGAGPQQTEALRNELETFETVAAIYDRRTRTCAHTAPLQY